MAEEGLEPSLPKELGFEPSVSAYSTTRPINKVMLLCEITSNRKLYRVTYYVGNRPRYKHVNATSKKSAISKVSKYGRVHNVIELPTSFGRAIDSLNW